jgi:hypothetical protein
MMVADCSTTREAMCVERNTETRWCNHCYTAQAINVSYSECVIVALGIQHTMIVLYVVICDLFGSTILFHIIS